MAGGRLLEGIRVLADACVPQHTTREDLASNLRGTFLGSLTFCIFMCCFEVDGVKQRELLKQSRHSMTTLSKDRQDWLLNHGENTGHRRHDSGKNRGSKSERQVSRRSAAGRLLYRFWCWNTWRRHKFWPLFKQLLTGLLDWTCTFQHLPVDPPGMGANVTVPTKESIKLTVCASVWLSLVWLPPLWLSSSNNWGFVSYLLDRFWNLKKKKYKKTKPANSKY